MAAGTIFQRNPTARRFLTDGAVGFHAETQEIFSTGIKPFMDSTSVLDEGGDQFRPWPLVERVRIYVKANILNPGITLVDLPGCGDAVQSRSEVAQKVSHTLDVRMVVSPIIRATDEKQGQSLMKNGFDEAQMRLRGKMNGRGFCVIASKMDDLTVDSYIAGCLELRRDKEVAQKQKQLEDLKHEKIDLSGTYKELKTLKDEQKRRLNNAAALFESAMQRHMSASQDNATASKKNMLNSQTQRNEANDGLNDAEQRLSDCELRLKEIPIMIKNNRHWIHHRAIQTRNSRVIESLRAGFDKRKSRLTHGKRGRKPHPDSSFILPILPISTRAFWQLKSNDNPMFGFPNEECTGIPAAKKWIHQATLAKREKHLDVILDRYDKLMALMRTYSATNGQDGNFNFTRSELQAILDPIHDLYTSKLGSKLSEACSEIRNLNLLEHKDVAKKRFLEEGPVVVQKWAYKDPQDPKTTPIVETLSRDWGHKIHEQLPLIRKPMMSDYSKLFAEYLDAIQNIIHDKIPMLSARFNELRPTLDNSKITTKRKIDQVLAKLTEEAIIITLDVAPRLRTEMKPTFAAARSDSGTGVYARRREAMEKKMTEDGTSMCDKVVDSLVDGVANKIARMPTRLRGAANRGPMNVKTQISCLINNLVENYSTDPETKAKKDKVQQNIRALVESWEAAWDETGNYGEHILDLDLAIPSTLPDSVI
ncbi:hypothetical protein HYE68_000264 [Fusarium pseudograminearum]|nr:hypothetical protein HYE68_000264 [Fusarium pseudograminearum]